MNLNKQYHQAKAKYDSAVSQFGENSRLAKYLQRELVQITNRILKRDRRKAA
jgi:hypothetical protein